MPIVPRLCTHPDNASPYAHAARFIVDGPAARLRWRLACLRLAPYLAFLTETLPHFADCILLEIHATMFGAPEELSITYMYCSRDSKHFG